MYEIIEKCDCKKVVVNAITLETLSLAQESIEKLGYEYSGDANLCVKRKKGRRIQYDDGTKSRFHNLR